jgi:DNA polymerase-3 subunit delta
MKPVVAVIGPRDAGPGERLEMQRRAHALLDQAGVDGVDRIDVPAKGGGDEVEGSLRAAVEPLVPALQSGSLFGGRRGVLVVDAHQLLRSEAEVAAALVGGVDGSSAMVVFVAEGSLPAPLAQAVKASGESVTVKKMRERDAADWLARESRERRIRLDPEAANALLQRFGSDVAALAQALDQLATVEGPVTGEEVASRFRNRPDEPMWHFSDAVAAGDTGEALRRLADFLTHGHPLQLTAFLLGDLRRRAMAAAAPDLATFASWMGAAPDHFPVRKAWESRERVPEEHLRRALDALARADLELKTAPESSHRVTIERLTVALTRWYGGGRRRRAG